MENLCQITDIIHYIHTVIIGTFIKYIHMLMYNYAIGERSVLYGQVKWGIGNSLSCGALSV